MCGCRKDCKNCFKICLPCLTLPPCHLCLKTKASKCIVCGSFQLFICKICLSSLLNQKDQIRLWHVSNQLPNSRPKILTMFIFSDGMLFALYTCCTPLRCLVDSNYARLDVKLNKVNSPPGTSLLFQVQSSSSEIIPPCLKKPNWKLWELGWQRMCCFLKLSQLFFPPDDWSLLLLIWTRMMTICPLLPALSAANLYCIHPTRPSQYLAPILTVSCFKHPLVCEFLQYCCPVWFPHISLFSVLSTKEAFLISYVACS